MSWTTFFLSRLTGHFWDVKRNEKQAARKKKEKRWPAQKRYWNVAESTCPWRQKESFVIKRKGPPALMQGARSSMTREPLCRVPALIMLPLCFFPSLPFPDAPPCTLSFRDPSAGGGPALFFLRKGQICQGGGLAGVF